MMRCNTKMSSPYRSAGQVNGEPLFIDKIMEKYHADDQLKHFLKQSEQYLLETEYMVRGKK